MKTERMKMMLAVLGVGTVLGLAACGGSGAGKGGDPQGSQTAKDQQDVRVTLSASSQQLSADGSAPVELTAILTDAESGVAIAGEDIAFAARDAANGVRIEVTQAQTDASGVAKARLFLNGDNTERDVTVLASVDQKTPAELVIRVSARATGTSVENNSRGELTIRLGTDNLIEDVRDEIAYRKSYAAIVTDNAGIPKANVTVLATLRSKKYYVGYWWKDTADAWFQVHLAPGGIDSEDVRNFGVCDKAGSGLPGEDVNNDMVLTPGNIASYVVRGQTNASGIAVIDIQYLKSYAQWAQMELEVTASVGGSEGFNAMTIPLPILAADVSNADVAPPSIARTRASLSTTTMAFAAGEGDEGSLTASPSPNAIVPGSPFPYQSITPTCN